MKDRNSNSRFGGGWGYTPANIEDGRRENERIDNYAKDQIDHFHTSELKTLQNDVEAKNKYLKDILLALPYIKDDIQSILDKYPPVFQIEKAGIIKDTYLYSATYLTDCPGISTIKTSISGCMLTDLYEAFAKCLRVIKSKKQSQVYNDYVDRIYNKSTVLEGSSKTSYDHIISRAQALHFLYDANTILELLIENGISHEYTDKPSTGQPEITELYMKIGTRYLRLFIKPQIDKKVDHIILNSYGKSSAGDINGIKHYAINHIKTTTRINELSKLELKRQEQELIDAEVERRLKKKQFEKKVLASIQEKEQLEKEKEKRFTEKVQKFQSEERVRVNIQGDHAKDVLRANKKRSPEVQRAMSSIAKVKPSNEVIQLKHNIPQYFNLMKEEIERDEINDYLKDIRKYDKYIQV